MDFEQFEDEDYEEEESFVIEEAEPINDSELKGLDSIVDQSPLINIDEPKSINDSQSKELDAVVDQSPLINIDELKSINDSQSKELDAVVDQSPLINIDETQSINTESLQPVNVDESQTTDQSKSTVDKSQLKDVDGTQSIIIDEAESISESILLAEQAAKLIDLGYRVEDSIMDEEEQEPLLLEEGGGSRPSLSGSGHALMGKRYTALRSRDKIAYGLGHVFNDICAALWFSYSLIFLQNVVGLGSFLAGILLFLGQAVDAISTPISGKVIDESGNRKKWYLTGTILVIISFPLIFMTRGSPLTIQLIYYSSLIILFQMGWALTQISHLSIIPDLSESPKYRAELTALRYTASVFANILVYVIAWFFLNGTNSTSIRMELIGPQHSAQFRKIALTSSCIGIVSSVLFYSLLKVRRPPCASPLKVRGGQVSATSLFRPQSKGGAAGGSASMYVQMFKSSMLYKVSILYTTSRLFLTISLIYVPIYINEYYSGSDSSIVASVPLASFLASLAASLCLKSFQSCAPSSVWRNNQVVFVVGSLLGLLGCIIILWTPFNSDQQVLNVYAAAICFGLGSSVTMVISLCSTANLVGTDTQYGAFIYSTVTFSDKLLNGLAVIIIEYLRCESKELCPTYYRQVLSYVNGALSIIGIAILFTLPKKLVSSH